MLCELRLKRSPRHFFPSGSHRFCFRLFTLLSHLLFPYVLPPFILIAFHLHCLHLASNRSTSESHSMVWFVICLFISLFLVTPSIYLTFFTPVSLSSFSGLLKKIACVHFLPFFFFCFPSPSEGLTFSPSLPPALLQCLFKQFHSGCTLLWLCPTLPLPISHGHTLYLCVCISESLYSSLSPCTLLLYFILRSYHSSSWCSPLL